MGSTEWIVEAKEKDLDSDIDIMYWQLDYQVIWEFSQSKCFNLNKQVLFLADSSKSPPGFTLLWLPYGRANEDIFFSLCNNA